VQQQSLGDGQDEGQGLAAAGTGAGDDVPAVVDVVERARLNGSQVLEAPVREQLGSAGRDAEGRDI
jgi:hypothetical protein